MTDPASAIAGARRPRDRKATIVAAAAELFAARGFAAVGLDDIGERVGITGPAIYRHFKGKDTLLDAVLLETVASFAVSDSAVTDGIRQVIGDAVATALDRPPWLATYVRERQRLSADQLRPMQIVERQEFRQWRRAIQVANPDLDDRRIGDRQTAVLAALSAVALRPLTMTRPQLDRLLVDALTAVLLHPPVDPPPPTPPKPTWAPPASRRDLILEHAMALFRSRGFRGVGIDEIGEAAGISGPTVYFYFDDKADILVDAFERAGTRVVAGVHEALSGASSAPDALERLVASYVEVAGDSVDLIVVTSREGHALPASARPRLGRRRREIRDAWVVVLRELRPDLQEGAARTLFAGVLPLINRLAQRGVGSTEAAQLAVAFLLSEKLTNV